MQASKRAQTAVFLTVLVDLLGFGIVIPLLPIYAKALAANPSPWMHWVSRTLGLQTPAAFWAGAVFVSFSLMQFLATPLLGRLSDRVGRRPVLWVSLIGSALGYLILAFTGRFEWVLAARILDGITGGNISVAQAAMADLTPPGERSKAMGLIGAAFGLGFVLGPFLGGTLAASPLGVHLADRHGWHLPFLVAGGLSLLASLLVALWLPETLKASARRAARAEEGRGHALVAALGRPAMPQVMAIALLGMTGFAMMEGTYSLLANQRFGFGQREVGYLFGFVGLLIVAYQGGLVRLTSRWVPERAALLSGLALMAAFLPLLPSAPWKWPFLLAMVPLAWGSGMVNTASSALASQLTPAGAQGGLFGALNAVSGVGRILGPALGTFVFARWGYAAAYWVSSAVVAAALALACTIPARSEAGEPCPGARADA